MISYVRELMLLLIMTLKVILDLVRHPTFSYFCVVERTCISELKKNPDNYYAMWFLGSLYVDHNKNQEAIILLETLINSNMSGTNVVIYLARAYFHMHDYGQVIEVLSRLDNIPKKSSANYYIGYSLIELGQVSNGIDYLNVYLDHHPKDYMVLWKLGYEYSKQNKIELALSAYEEAAKINPSVKEIQDNIRNCYEKLELEKGGTH